MTTEWRGQHKTEHNMNINEKYFLLIEIHLPKWKSLPVQKAQKEVVHLQFQYCFYCVLTSSVRKVSYKTDLYIKNIFVMTQQLQIPKYNKRTS